MVLYKAKQELQNVNILSDFKKGIVSLRAGKAEKF